MKPHEILAEAAETFRTRNAVYKNNYKHIGPVMAGYFPEGIQLLTSTDYIRFHLFMLIHVKLTRYTNNWANGHQDSLRDISVYAAMLESVDAEELGVLDQLVCDLDEQKLNPGPGIIMDAPEQSRSYTKIDLEAIATSKLNSHPRIVFSKDESGHHTCRAISEFETLLAVGKGFTMGEAFADMFPGVRKT